MHDIIQEKIAEAKPLTLHREQKIRKIWQGILDKLNEVADPIPSEVMCFNWRREFTFFQQKIWNSSLSIYIKVVKNIRVQCSKKPHSSGYLFFLSELLQEFIYCFLLKTSSNNLIEVSSPERKLPYHLLHLDRENLVRYYQHLDAKKPISVVLFRTAVPKRTIEIESEDLSSLQYKIDRYSRSL